MNDDRGAAVQSETSWLRWAAQAAVVLVGVVGLAIAYPYAASGNIAGAVFVLLAAGSVDAVILVVSRAIGILGRAKGKHAG